MEAPARLSRAQASGEGRAMAEQERARRRGTGPERREDEPVASPAVAAKGRALKKRIDDVVDEIDSVLEDNAEEFVKSYVQRGGE